MGWVDKEIPNRKLLALDEEPFDATAEIKKLDEEKNAAIASEKAQFKLEHSPQCIGKINYAYRTCSILTTKCYDKCNEVLTEADATFNDDLRTEEKADEEEAGATTKSEETTTTDHETTTTEESTTDEASDAEDSDTSESAETSTSAEPSEAVVQQVAATVPAEVGATTVVPQVAKDVATEYVHNENVASSLAAAHDAAQGTDYPHTTEVAKAAEAKAKAATDLHAQTTTDALAAANDSDGSTESLWQQQANLYNEIINED